MFRYQIHRNEGQKLDFDEDSYCQDHIMISTPTRWNSEHFHISHLGKEAPAMYRQPV